MGMTFVKAKIRDSKKSKNIYEGDFLIDSGAFYTVLPKEVWKKLGLEAEDRKVLRLANGDIIERDISTAYIAINGVESSSPVILGEKDDSYLIGALTLEALNLGINPVNRTLYPLHLMM
jgi:clan AA aspartic protease